MKMLSAPRAVFCLFTLLNVVLLNNFTLSNDHVVSSPAVSGFPRHLSEIKKNSNNNDSSKNKRTRERYKELLADSLFTEHSDNAALLAELSEKEFLVHNKRNRGSINNREMVALLNGFDRLYVIEHARMLKGLSNTLNDLSTKYKIPAKEAGDLWKECKNSIESEHNKKMDSHKPRYNSLVMSCSASVADFGDFYKYYVRTLYKGLKKSEKKWKKKITERVSKYGVASPKQKA
ncbi:RAD protein (Pv-fam-e) [Plasmodium vivax]|uniref:RAD protein (Pv-fam-e) n=1 Tax=Plasmodium vivax (strain Salvador I) TaxID=126793 RepID=A5K603_PLAVS|nr:RAD protein (Pv-fam-e) [Plasmodium vivax]EDL45338.1 RAD protein (Pv-fam-e) [Plasmodium vivax]|eukprot:XP_001615065.1 RAD protein (Pv-fam-e) [Plasmodium vivax Sal-1]